MPIVYKIDKELSLIYMLFYGNVDKQEAFSYSNKLEADPNYDQTKSSLVIIRGSTLVYSIEDAESFGHQMAMNKSINFRNKIAILVENPSNTVAATIYAHALTEMKKDIQVELFYTLDAALNFLDLSEHYDRIKNGIEEKAKYIEN